MSDDSGAMKKSKPAMPQPNQIPQTKPTGQGRSKERGKHTHKKNPGKRARSGGS